MKFSIVSCCLGLAVLSGCVTTPPAIHTVLSNSSDVLDVTGLTDELVRDKDGILVPKSEKHNFSLQDTKVVWWANVSNQFRYTGAPGVTVEWIAPGGNLYKKDRFSVYANAAIMSTLPVKNKLDASHQGEWKVRAFIGDAFYDETAFVLGDVDHRDFDIVGLDKALREFLELDIFGAIAIFDNRTVRIEEDGTYITRHHARLKVLSERGKHVAEVSIPFNRQWDVFRIIKAQTIIPGGKTIDATAYGVVGWDPGYPDYTGTALLRIAMPAVEVGSILEYEVEIVSTAPIVEKRILYNMLLPLATPTLSSTIKVSFPTSASGGKVQARLYNANVEPVVTRGVLDKHVYTWNLKSLKGIVPENYLPPYADLVPYLILSDYGSWDEVAGWAYEHVRSESDTKDPLPLLVSEITRGSRSKKESAQRILRYVQDNIRYVAVTLGRSRERPQPIDAILRNKYGDCKDCSNLLNAMLEQAGLKAYRALVTTKDEGGLHLDVPFPYQFNHVVSVLDLDGEYFWMDPTDKDTRLGKLPDSVQGVPALVLTGGAVDFRRTPTDTIEDLEVFTENAISIEGSSDMRGVFRLTVQGSVAEGYRRANKLLSSKELEQKFQSLVSNFLGPVETVRAAVVGEGEPGQQMTMELRYIARNRWVIVGENLSVAPLKQYHNTWGALADSARRYDIWTTSLYSRIDKLTVETPKGYVAQGVPKDFHIRMPFAEASGTFERRDDGVEMVFTERVTKQQIKAEDYKEVLKYRRQVAQYLSEPILFRMRDEWSGIPKESDLAVGRERSS